MPEKVSGVRVYFNDARSPVVHENGRTTRVEHDVLTVRDEAGSQVAWHAAGEWSWAETIPAPPKPKPPVVVTNGETLKVTLPTDFPWVKLHTSAPETDAGGISWTSTSAPRLDSPDVPKPELTPKERLDATLDTLDTLVADALDAAMDHARGGEDAQEAVAAAMRAYREAS